MQSKELEAHAEQFLRLIGEDPEREGLQDTPARFSRSVATLFSGYQRSEQDLDALFRNFKSENDHMVVQTGIPVRSFCEHHILPFIGTCNIGYVPDGKVIGASKLTRVVDHFSRRLQIQEQLTEQVAGCLMEKLKPLGVMITMRCVHLCMLMRGIQQQGPTLTTSKVCGCFKDQQPAREEFLLLTGGPPNLLL